MATNKISSSSSSSFCSKFLVTLFLLGTLFALALGSTLVNNDNAQVAGEVGAAAALLEDQLEMRQDGNGTAAEVAQGGGPGVSSSGSRKCQGSNNRNEHCYQSNYCQSDRTCRNNRDCCRCGGLGSEICRDYCNEKWGRDWNYECYDCYCRCYRGRD